MAVKICKCGGEVREKQTCYISDDGDIIVRDETYFQCKDCGKKEENNGDNLI